MTARDGPPIGIIPAYAGNTYILYQCETGGRDHPRVCGEHQGFLDLLNEGRGSSPPPSVPRDHPRVCGEHCFSVNGLISVPGSSPRMRGTLVSTVNPRLNHGIIPAYAGNTDSSGRRRTSGRDHPRVCGEHQSTFTRAENNAGSSPRMRGTRSGGGQFAYQRGIIPAYAGNTGLSALRATAAEDHPRVCGEHYDKVKDLATSQGSSPRMRGTHIDPRQRYFTTGIIPAYAGNTRRWPERG